MTSAYCLDDCSPIIWIKVQKNMIVEIKALDIVAIFAALVRSSIPLLIFLHDFIIKSSLNYISLGILMLRELRVSVWDYTVLVSSRPVKA